MCKWKMCPTEGIHIQYKKQLKITLNGETVVGEKDRKKPGKMYFPGKKTK